MIILQNSYDANVAVTSHGAHSFSIAGYLNLTGAGKIAVGVEGVSYSAARLFLEKLDNESIAAGQGAIRVFDMTESLYK